MEVKVVESMDITAVAGLASGMALVVWGIMLGGSLKAFWDFPSFVIVFGGACACIMINFPLKQLLDTGKIFRLVFIEKKAAPLEVIQTLVNFATKARREGLLALENDAEALSDDFLKRGIRLVVDGTDPELVRNILETDWHFWKNAIRPPKACLTVPARWRPLSG